MLGSPQCMPPCCAWGSCEGGRRGWGRSSHLPQLLLCLGGGAQQRVDEGADGVGGPGTIRRAVV